MKRQEHDGMQTLRAKRISTSQTWSPLLAVAFFLVQHAHGVEVGDGSPPESITSLRQPENKF